MIQNIEKNFGYSLCYKLIENTIFTSLLKKFQKNDNIGVKINK